ncbi:hypothetical protein QZH41_014071 [Actinostola sp. cb2023]|nr:hypothetical protein QZH41_014071 [Actinostola sp. cb2023]
MAGNTDIADMIVLVYRVRMLDPAAEDGYGESGEEFFRKIMDETSTSITWPSKLKIGAKSKKDPHIKICGLPESVKMAKDRVMAVLDTKSEVAVTNVSIAGQPLGVEAARKQIRDMLPLVLMFELPLTARGPEDSNSSIIQHIAQTTNVNITFKHEAVSRLVEYFTGNIASPVVVNMQIDIAPQHHLFIIGRNGSNIKHITNQTGAHVGFPDQSSSHRRGVVFLSGSVEAVICARALLLDCLPLVLMFDLREEDGDVDSVRLNKIMEDYNVFVSVKPKPKQPSKSVIIKSGERNANNIYLARMEILGFDRNQNRASPVYPSTIISPSNDRSFSSRHHEYGSSPPISSYSGHCNGNISPIFSTTSWNSGSSQGVRLITSPVNDLSNLSSTPFTFAQSNPPPAPPPGLGPPNSLACQPVVSTSSGYGDFSISPSESFGSIDSLSGK